MNKLVSTTCTNCSWRSDTPNEIGQWLCHIYTKWYDPKHFCQRHKLLTVEDREKRNYYSKQLMDNIKPSTIAKQFQTVENTHKNLTIRRFEPLPKEDPMTMGADMNSEPLIIPNNCETCRLGIPCTDGVSQKCLESGKVQPNDHTCKKHTPLPYRKLIHKEPDQTIKADAGKEQLRLVPPQIMFDIARIREYGNNKYGDSESWKRVDPNRYIDAMLRHALAFAATPESADEESGLPHLWHLACNVAFLSEFYKDKFKKGE